MEISFPFEFVVRGTPVSLGAKRAETKAAWKDTVKAPSTRALPAAHFATDLPLAITLFYFPRAAMEGDIDNIVKPILDALCRQCPLRRSSDRTRLGAKIRTVPTARFS